MESNTQSHEAFPMKGGDGEYSYAQNSTRQRRGANMTKNTVKEAILEKLDLEMVLQHSYNVFRIADLGCSVGPNTFFTVQNIIEAVNLKLQSQGYGLDKCEFQAFFNDHVGNDFNTLFKSLPEEKQYYVGAVPGSFHERLFPKSSIHFFNSSYAVQWLSMAPKEIVDKNSPAYNKGKIYFTSADKEVKEAYSAQFARDIESFLSSRALELIPGGIMALLIPIVPANSKNRFEALASHMGDVLVEMASKGLISDELVDSFNLPMCMPTLEDVKELIEKNGNFKIEKSQSFFDANLQKENVQDLCMHIRAGWEELLKKHFGGEVMDEIFIQFEKKLEESSFFTDPSYKQMGHVQLCLRII